MFRKKQKKGVKKLKGKISTKIAITTNFLLVVLTCSTLFISVFDSIGGLRSLIPL